MIRINKVGLIWIFAWGCIFWLDIAFGLKELFCCKGLNIIGTEYYRFFTGLLLHVNLFHIWANMITMFFVCNFLNGKIKDTVLFAFSLIAGTLANFLFSMVSPQGYMIGGSPAIFALIGLIVVLQWKRKDLPRFKLGTWYGNWIVGYALFSNIPFFSKDFSTLIIHVIGFVVGLVFGMLVVLMKDHR